jgi:hypothetical protein
MADREEERASRVKHAIPLFLGQDAIDHIDRLCVLLGKRAQQAVSRSEAVEWLVEESWKRHQVRQAERKHDLAVAGKLA